MLTRQTTSDSPEATEEIGARLGANLRGGEVIELASDLGGGKTTIVHGIARGIGSTDNVASPSFTLSREYKAGKLTLYHFDFYRLNVPGIMAEELAEIINDPLAVVIVEWASIVESILPANRLTIKLNVTGQSQRKLVFKYPTKLSYLIPEET